MRERSSILAANLASLAESTRNRRRQRKLAADRTLQALVADLERYALAVGASVEIRLRTGR